MTSAPNFFDDAPQRVAVLLPLPLETAYDYLVPGEINVAAGDFVEVPLGPRRVVGVVWDEPTGDVDDAKLKAIIRRLPVPGLPASLRKFVSWVARYTLYREGQVLALAMRSREALEEPKMVSFYRYGGTPPARMTAPRERLIEVVSDQMARTPQMMSEEAGVSPSVVRGLIKADLFEEEARRADVPFDMPDPDFCRQELNEHQAKAADELKGLVQAKTFSATLLDGVTGSGKTEVYFDAVADAVAQGGQVLILLPEIALTLQVCERFEARFGVAPARWHSGLSPQERRRVWRGVAEGEARVVIGARSALFLPFQELELIIVDEEHDGSYKQGEGFIYHARDMSVVRGMAADIPVVLASATPALETCQNVAEGKYGHIVLPSRHGAAGLPDVQAIDMREAELETNRWLSSELIHALKETFEAGEQAMLFLNRRGYAPLTICRACGHRMMAPDSQSWLVEHRFRNELVCHLTGFSMPKPDKCPECGAEHSLAACGPGVERVAEEVAELFPDIRTEIMSSDLVWSAEQAEALVKRMEDKEIDLLIGTQIVAKGHNFPNLTLVGVVDADLGLKGGDLRAAERTFQLLHQVAGRAGRAEKPGRVFLQTFMPDHEVMAAMVAGRRDEFVARESYAREMAEMPPFGRLVALVFSGPEEATVLSFARQVVSSAPPDERFSILGPAAAPVALVRGRYRFRVLIKARRNANVQAYLREWLKDLKVPGQLRMAVDVDPYSFL